MDKVYSDKQLQLMRLWQRDKLKRINILEGSVRSGKTWISLVLWAFWVATMPKGGNYLMVAKTLTSLRRNCLDLLQELVGTKNFTYSLSKKEGHLFGRLIYLEGVNDARAESKIRGMTLQGAYCDELTLFTEDFFAMLLSRLSQTGAKLIGTTNPDSPNHWLKADYIDMVVENDLDMMTMKFLIDDNIFLDKKYVENLKKEYTGVFYDRFILGLWVLAEGLIYPNARDAVVETKDRKYTEYQISADYGIHNPTCFALFGKCGKTWYMVKEYYHSGRDTHHQKTDDEYYTDLVRFAGDLPIKLVTIDPSASSFITLIKRRGRFPVKNADNTVLDGIRRTAAALSNGEILINDCCKHMRKEFDAYSWDDRKGTDEPIQESDHLCDALRYFTMTNLSGKAGWQFMT